MPTRVKALLVLCALAGVGIFVALPFIGGNQSGCPRPDAIEELLPGCDQSVVPQASFGVTMAIGYQAELTLNGIPIPLDETSTPDLTGGTNIAGALPQRFVFAPGQGRTFEQLPAGLNRATVRYWRVTQTMNEAQEFSWSFEAA